MQCSQGQSKNIQTAHQPCATEVARCNRALQMKQCYNVITLWSNVSAEEEGIKCSILSLHPPSFGQKFCTLWNKTEPSLQRERGWQMSEWRDTISRGSDQMMKGKEVQINNSETNFGIFSAAWVDMNMRERLLEDDPFPLFLENDANATGFKDQRKSNDWRMNSLASSKLKEWW